MRMMIAKVGEQHRNIYTRTRSWRSDCMLILTPTLDRSRHGLQEIPIIITHNLRSSALRIEIVGVELRRTNLNPALWAKQFHTITSVPGSQGAGHAASSSKTNSNSNFTAHEILLSSHWMKIGYTWLSNIAFRIVQGDVFRRYGCMNGLRTSLTWSRVIDDGSLPKRLGRLVIMKPGYCNYR